MIILKADYILPFGETSDRIIRSQAIAFDTHIVAIGPVLGLRKRYPEAVYTDLGKNSVIMPALVNAHLHLEFSANKTTLKYGDFHQWLDSVIEHREKLMNRCDESLMLHQLTLMAKTGTGSVGAISSYGYDLQALQKSPLKVRYFCETIGANPALVDTMTNHLLSRIDEAKMFCSDRFGIGIAIHSPYSVHPALLQSALEEARQEGYPVTAHFMESPQERAWLENSQGSFATFFKNFLGITQAHTTPRQFLESFEGLNPSFTHVVNANEEERSLIHHLGGSLIHCPTSNRLLQVGTLPYRACQVQGIPIALGTDGLSSNISLSMWDEMRTGLMIHATINPSTLAWDLLHHATTHSAHVLGFNNGALKEGFASDLITLTLPDDLAHDEDLALQLILHTQHVHNLYINGERHV